jgi:hypothetical protein
MRWTRRNARRTLGTPSARASAPCLRAHRRLTPPRRCPPQGATRVLLYESVRVRAALLEQVLCANGAQDVVRVVRQVRPARPRRSRAPLRGAPVARGALDLPRICNAQSAA